MRQVTSLHENFAPNVSNSLGAYLRVAFQTSLVAVEQLAYSDFLGRLPEQTYFANAAMIPVEEMRRVPDRFASDISDDRSSLGGPGHGLAEPRDLTEIEEQITRKVVAVICRELQVDLAAGLGRWSFSAEPAAETVSDHHPDAAGRARAQRELRNSGSTDIRGSSEFDFSRRSFPMRCCESSRQQGMVHRRRRPSADSAARIRERLLDAGVIVNLDIATRFRCASAMSSSWNQATFCRFASRSTSRCPSP